MTEADRAALLMLMEYATVTRAVCAALSRPQPGLGRLRRDANWIADEATVEDLQTLIAALDTITTDEGRRRRAMRPI